MITPVIAANKKSKTLTKKKNSSHKTIKVGFIVQLPEVWDKEAPLYENMLLDKRFDCYLIIVPNYDIVHNKLAKYGEEKKYFYKKYPNANIVLLKNKHDNPIDDSFDFVFYQRCWENYLPKQLRCKSISRYAMTCYIPYCYHCAPETTDYYRNDFFWYLSRFYCCSKEQHFQVSKIRGVTSTYLGFPVLETIKHQFSTNDNSKVNILWTPRWSDDLSLGGTAFKKYKDNIFELKDVSDNVNLVLRPHPLLFENAIKNKWMTDTEVNQYYSTIKEKGALLDENEFIEETFNNTDILVTDFSSSIVFFFLTGRPIIYCTEQIFKVTKVYKCIYECLYIAKSFEEVKQITADLVNGIDPLYEKRQETIKKIKGKPGSVERIKNDLLNYLYK